MSNDTPPKAILVVLLTALVCSSLVSAAVVILRPIQLNNQMLDRSRNIMQLTGLVPREQAIKDDDMLELYKSLDLRIINIDAASFDQEIDPDTFDKRRAQNDPERSVAIPSAQDQANLGRRSRFAPIYIVWNEEGFERLILPVRGAGMWSLLYGYIALEPDLNTISGMTFYEQNETPGQPGTGTAKYEVDALTGATVTANAVTSLIHYWFGPHGYQPFLLAMREQPPERPAELDQ